MKKFVPVYEGELRKHSIQVPHCISECSGIRIFGRRIKSLAFSTDVAIIKNINADAIIAVYPFTPQPVISQAIISVSDVPVFVGVGGGITTGSRSVRLAIQSEHQGAYGVVLNAPTSDDVIRQIKKVVDIPVVIVHLTNAATLAEVTAARRRGQKVYVETCPQYLVLDDSVYYNEDFSRAARYVCAPPLRKPEDCRALWAGLRKGDIQTISTDHCAFTLAQKDAGRGDFTKIPGGLPGVEARGELVYSFGVTTRKISLATMCKVLSENPAKLYGMFPRKGIIAPGADADIVVYDPQADHILRAEDMVSRAGYTPYEGFVTHGSVSQVWLRGKLMVENGHVIGEQEGQYIVRGKSAL